MRKFHSTPSRPTRVVGDHASEPRPPHEVKKPMPDDGSHTASSSTLQTPTPPMRIDVCFFFFVSFVAFVRAHFLSCAQRPNDSSRSTVYPEYQEAPSPRAPDTSHQPSFSAYQLTNIPATEQGEHHGLSIV